MHKGRQMIRIKQPVFFRSFIELIWVIVDKCWSNLNSIFQTNALKSLLIFIYDILIRNKQDSLRESYDIYHELKYMIPQKCFSKTWISRSVHEAVVCLLAISWNDKILIIVYMVAIQYIYPIRLVELQLAVIKIVFYNTKIGMWTSVQRWVWQSKNWTVGRKSAGGEGGKMGVGIGGMTKTKYECGYLLSGIVNFSVWRTVPHERHK